MTNMRIAENLEYQIVENYNQVNSQSISTAHVVYDFEYLLSHFRGKRRKDVSNIFHLMVSHCISSITSSDSVDRYIKNNCKKRWNIRDSTFYALACKLPDTPKRWIQCPGIDGSPTFEDLD